MAVDVDTIVDAMRLRRRDGQKIRFRFLSAKAEPRELGFDELIELAARQAAALRGAGLAPGDRVVLMLRSDFDFVRMLLGAFAGGFVPVPLYPPTSIKRIDHYLQNLSAILNTAAPRALVVLPEVREVLEIVRRHIPAGTAIHVLSDLSPAEQGRGIELAEVTPETPAFIQFSSGSTGVPKGSIVSHANVLANLRGLVSRTHDTADDTMVSWLPLYHDMGLLALLRPLIFGYHFVLMEPDTFLRRPSRLLRAVSDYRGTIGGGPSFAFALCSRKIPDAELEGVDLSSWRVVYNGAEPIQTDVVEAFIQKFAPYGFRREAMYPCYGLSEFTLAATVPELGKVVLARRFRRSDLEERGVATPVEADQQQDVVSLAGLGTPPEGHDLRILDRSSGQPLPDGRVGEVVVTGPSLTQGYLNAPERTSKAFGPWVPGDDRRWLRTGDAGFFLDGQLYVLGRGDDMIIIRGRNVDPMDIEAIASSVPGVRPGCCAAVQVERTAGKPRLTLIAEARPGAKAQELEQEVSTRVRAALGVQLDDVVLIAPGMIPKTSSGKIARNAARQALLEGQLRDHGTPDWVRAAQLKLRVVWNRGKNQLRRVLGRGA